jgi:hypothetical protein
MSAEIIEIDLNNETTFDFDLSITGLSTNDTKVRFNLQLPSFTVQIPCTRADGNTWNVTIPILEDVVEEGQYAFTIELFANGYHFTPVKGNASLKPVAEVVSTTLRKNVKINVSGIKKSNKKPEKKEKKTEEDKAEEKVVKQAEKKEEKKEKKKKKETKESATELMMKKFKPLEKGKSILSQLTDRPEELLTEQEKKVRDLLKNI